MRSESRAAQRGGLAGVAGAVSRCRSAVSVGNDGGCCGGQSSDDCWCHRNGRGRRRTPIPASINSAVVVGLDGQFVGRYDKIHLVPFGEYVPFRKLLFFVKQITQTLTDMSTGTERKVFTIGGHRYGVFICYESVFGDEVREFASNGAEVLVNISDDGWYGDTSAPWQHLNMARMRAIENRRWILRDTNNGVTAAIDPYGTVRQSIPRQRWMRCRRSMGIARS